MNKLANAIKCVNCKNVLESPVILPCGHSICNLHSIDVKDSVFCSICQIEHTIPICGHFPANKAIAEVINAQNGSLESLDFGRIHREAKNFCQYIEQLITQIENYLKDPYNFTYEAISQLKNVVYLRSEEMKMKIDENANNLITKLDKYNQDCKENLTSSEFMAKTDEIKFNNEVARNELNNWINKLNDTNLYKQEWFIINLEAEKAIKRFENELYLFKSHFLLLKRFEEFQNEIELNFGEFKMNPLFDLE